MAVRWMDGFEHYGNYADTQHNGVTLISDNISVPLARNYNTVSGTCFAGPGRYAGQSFRGKYNKNNSQIKKAISSSGVTHFIIGFNLRLNFTAAGDYFNVTNGTFSTTKGLNIVSLSGSNAQIYLNNTLLSTVTFATVNTWKHYEIYMPLTPSGGDTAKLYIDGVLIGTTTNSMTYDGTFTFHGSSTYNETWYQLDDLYILDNTGSTNNTRLGTELIVPRVEYLQPSSSDIAEFTNTGGSTTLTEGFEANTSVDIHFKNLGCSNITYPTVRHNGSTTQTVVSRITAHARTGSACLNMYSTLTNPVGHVQFTTVANSFSFWVKVFSGSSSINITVNGTTTNHAVYVDYAQITVTLTDDISIVKIAQAVNAVSTYFDDFSFDYTGDIDSQVVGLNYFNSAKYLQSTTNGNRVQFNTSNLTNINNVKAVQLVSLQSESQSEVTSLSKFLVNDTEVGSTKSVTGSLQTTTPYQTEILETNPATSTAWTVSDINGVKTGIINKT